MGEKLHLEQPKYNQNINGGCSERAGFFMHDCTL